MMSSRTLFQDRCAGRGRRSCAPWPCWRRRAARPRGTRARTPSISNSLLVLLDQGVLGLGQDAHQRLLVQLVQRRDHRQAADELGDQAVPDQVLGLDLAAAARRTCWLLVRARAPRRRSRCRPSASGRWMIFSRPAKAPPQMNRMLRGVDLQEFLLRMLAPALRRHRGDRALDQLEQRLLHALAGHVAGDRGVVALARDLVDLVDVDDAASAPSRRRSRTSAAASG